MSKLMEQRYPNSYRTLTACSAWQVDLFLYLDGEEELIGCNDAVLELTGFESFEKLQAKRATLPQLFVPESGRELPEVGSWHECAAAEKLYVRIKDRHGGIRLYRVHMKTVELDERPLYLVILNEKTEFEKAGAARRYYETVTQNLLSSISRQFRTPLNSIVGFAGLLEHTHLDAVQREYMTHIRDASETITSTVDNLIELMQVERGDFELKQVFFDPLELFEPISTRYGALAQAKGITLLYMFDPALPRELLGDAKKIARVMRNLMDNAIKFTGAGGQVYVEVRCLECGRERALIEYSVADTGTGIAEEALDTIVRPFAAVQSDETVGAAGLGIGLHVSHRLLGAMQAKLRVASQVGRGSRFSFRVSHRISEPQRYTLPEGLKAAFLVPKSGMALQGKLLQNYLEQFGVAAEEIAGTDAPLPEGCETLFVLDADIRHETIEALKSRHEGLKVAAVVTPAREEALQGEGLGADYLLVLPLLPDRIFAALTAEHRSAASRREQEERAEEEEKRASILIAEDNPINQKLLKTLLKKFQYDVEVVHNGQEAVDAYEQRPFDLVLMDIDMPVMDGITATHLIREIDKKEKRRRVPVFALTAHALPGDKERILEAGLDAHLPKPVDMAILLRMIKKFLKESRGNIRPPSV
jgi:two-component system sensor histidine kinase/response regulator